MKEVKTKINSHLFFVDGDDGVVEFGRGKSRHKMAPVGSGRDKDGSRLNVTE